MLDAAAPVLEASGGRAFLLFTTLRALRRAHERLRGMLPYPLLVQGTGSRSELLARFRSLGNAVLLGAQSFWEGVDVRGEALSVVVIDKLPFAPPDDPVLAARIEAIRARGGNPFTELQLPQAVLSLKQGAGRLIRDESDRGRPDAVRPAARREGLRTADSEEPAADEAYARAGRGAELPWSSSSMWARMMSSKLESARKPSAARASRRSSAASLDDALIVASGSRRMSFAAWSPATLRSAAICSPTVALIPGMLKIGRAPSCPVSILEA